MSPGRGGGTSAAGLAPALRWLRYRARLRQVDLADLAGLSLPYVKQLELGQRTPADAALGRLLAALGSDADELGRLLADRPWVDEPPPAAGRAPRISARTPRPAAYRQAAERALAASGWSSEVGGPPAPPGHATDAPPHAAELVDLWARLTEAQRREVLADLRRRVGSRGRGG